MPEAPYRGRNGAVLPGTPRAGRLCPDEPCLIEGHACEPARDRRGEFCVRCREIIREAVAVIQVPPPSWERRVTPADRARQARRRAERCRVKGHERQEETYPSGRRRCAICTAALGGRPGPGAM